MTRKQLQVLISAGVFSAAILSGAAYADDSSNAQNSVQVSSGTTQADSSGQASDKHATSTSKDAGQHGCSGANGCGGK